MPQVDTERGDRLAHTALVVAMVVSAATILLLGRHLTFWSDELDWLTFADDFGIRSLLTPHGSHLIATTRVIYEGLPRIFGTSYLPFRILGIVCLQAGAVLTFVLIRRRMGAVVAVFPAILLLFFGSAQDMTISPLGIPFTLSIALGLGAFALVELNGFRTDLAATALLILAGLSHTFGAIVAFGVLVYLLVERGRRREVWIAVVPLALWAAWWLWARQFDQGIAESSNILGTPLFVLKAAGAAILGILGLSSSNGIGSTGASLLRAVFDIVALGALAGLAIRLRRGPTGPWGWAYSGTILAFWIGIALSQGEGRDAVTPRYLFFGAIMIFLIVAELMRDQPVPRRAIRPLLAIFTFSLICNVALMFRSVDDFNQSAARVRAEIAAVGFDSDFLDQYTRLGHLDPSSGAQVPSSPAALAAFAADVGSTGFTLEELLAQPEDVRLATDLAIVRALKVTVAPLPPRFVSKQCTSYSPGNDGYANFPLSGGGNAVRLRGDTGEPGAAISVGRYADVASVPIGDLTEGGAVIVLLPEDDLSQPWIGRAAGRIDVCGVVGDPAESNPDG